MAEEEKNIKKEEEEEEEGEEEEEEGGGGGGGGGGVVIDLYKIIGHFTYRVHDVPVHKLSNGTIMITIPSSLLPITLRVAFGFSDDDTLFQISLMLKDNSWTTKLVCEIKNPSCKYYCGICLVEEAKDNFFSSTFKPKPNYRSAPIFFRFIQSIR